MTDNQTPNPSEILELIIDSPNESWNKGSNAFDEPWITVSIKRRLNVIFHELSVHSMEDKIECNVSIHFQPLTKLFIIEWSEVPFPMGKMADRDYIQTINRLAPQYDCSGVIIVTEQSEPSLWQRLHEKMFSVSKLSLKNSNFLCSILK